MAEADPAVPPRAETVPAERIGRGDVLMLDDGVLAEITDLRVGDYWMSDGQAGLDLGWRAVAGSASGVLFRPRSAVLCRVVTREPHA